MKHFTLALTICLSVSFSDFAHAQESLDQLEPSAGEKQIEWLGNFGGDGEQGFELLAGVSDRLVIGGEIEFEGPKNGLIFDEASAILLYRFTDPKVRSEEHTSELQSLMRISYAVFCLTKKKNIRPNQST